MFNEETHFYSALAYRVDLILAGINRAHRFRLAWQRVVDIQEYNPLGGGEDD